MIVQKLFVLLVGTLTCIAAVAAGWDAEAARWHRRACCYETVCCDPCATPVCTTACAPACERVCVTYRDPCTNCCTSTCSYRVVNEYWVAATPSCCEPVIVASTVKPAETALAPASKPAGTTVVAKR